MAIAAAFMTVTEIRTSWMAGRIRAAAVFKTGVLWLDDGLD